MAAALSLDLRARVIAAIEAGASCKQAAERFGIGKAGAIRWHARFRAAFGKLKRFKRVALRCEKAAKSFASIVSLALGFILLKSVHTA